MNLSVSVLKNELFTVCCVGWLALGATGCGAGSGAGEAAPEGVSASTSAVFSPTLPSGWVKTAIGPVPSDAYGRYDPTTAAWDIGGGGSGLFSTSGAKGADNVYFVNKTLAGDGEVTFIAQTFSVNPEARIMIRSQLSASSSHVAVGWARNLNGADFVARSVINGPVSQSFIEARGLWFKLTRRGNTITGYASLDGFFWARIAVQATLPDIGAAAAYGLEVAGPNSPFCEPTQLLVGKLPLALVSQDIGGASPGGTGAVDYDRAGGTLTIAGGGSGVKGTSDSFQFSYRTLVGDGTLIARLEPPNGTSTVKSGIMLRKSLASNASHAFIAMDNSDRLVFNSRATAGGATSADAFFTSSFGGWVKVVRSGTTVSTSSSLDGVSWTPFRGVTLSDLGSTVYVGVAVASGANGVSAVGELDNLKFQPVNPQ